jgi:Chaperone of endosialidase
MNNGGGVAGYVPNPYVLNLIGLQNTQTNSSGVNTNVAMSNALCNLEQMVNFGTKTIYTNNLSNFNATPLQILTDLNLSNTNLYQNSNLVIFNTSTITTGNTLTYGSTTAYVSTGGLFVNGAGVFTGSVSATNFITPSDSRLKMKIETLANSEWAIGQLRGVRFEWRDTGAKDIGFIAQEISQIIPEAVVAHAGELYVAYDKVVPLLVETVKTLLERVNRLEQIVGWEKEKE